MRSLRGVWRLTAILAVVQVCHSGRFGCRDKEPMCANWALTQECTTNPSFMLESEQPNPLVMAAGHLPSLVRLARATPVRRLPGFMQYLPQQQALSDACHF
jgi:hypothetical protein